MIVTLAYYFSFVLGECPCPCWCGECPCLCWCPRVGLFFPVCGVDGQTYADSCDAKCAGQQIDCYGECPCDKINFPLN